MPAMNASPSILLVDDEQSILEAYRHYLTVPAQRAGRGEPAYRLLFTRTGPEAHACVERELTEGRRVAGGFFDMAMHPWDGLETIRRVRELDPDILCTVVSGVELSTNDVDELFQPDHADEWDYLAKPFGRWEIRQKCCQMVQSWNRRRREETHVHEIQRLNRRLDEWNESLRRRTERKDEAIQRLAVELDGMRAQRDALSRRLTDSAPPSRRRSGSRVTEDVRTVVRTLLLAGHDKATISRALRLHRSTVWKLSKELARSARSPRTGHEPGDEGGLRLMNR